MRWQRLVALIRFVLAGLIGSVVSASALAQASPAPEVFATGAGSPTESLLNDRFVIAAGGFALVSKINGSLNGTASTADQNLDFSQRFGTDADQTRWRADALWRITPTQHLRIGYFDNDVRRTRTIDRDLVWGDYTFLLGGQVTAETKFRVYELSYEFAFLRRRNYEIVPLVGIHLDNLTAKLSGNASLTVDTPSGPVHRAASFTTKSNSVPAPLPVLGLRADWAISPHVYGDAAGEVFKLNYQGIDGTWSDLRAGVTWMFSEHFGLGVGYDRFATHVDLSKASFSGRLNFGYQGGLIFLKGGF